MNREPLILVGGGGHCKSCIDVIEAEGRYSIAGIVDVREKLHRKLLGYEVIGHDNDLPALVADYGNFLITLGHLRSPAARIRLFVALKELGARLPIVISPLARVARTATLGEGSIVMHGTVVNADAKIGKNCIINTGAIVEHDAIVGDHTHISTGCTVNGECRVGTGCFVGSRSVLVQTVSVPDETMVGAGAVVTRSIADPGIYAGIPAKRIR